MDRSDTDCKVPFKALLQFLLANTLELLQKISIQQVLNII